MAGTIYSGTYTSGINLTNPATQRPVTVTGRITASAPNSNGVFGNADLAWTVNNKGTIQDAGAGSIGVQLEAGGTIGNLVAGSVSPGGVSGAALIEGYGAGVVIRGAPGAVANLGQIAATGTSGIGVEMTAGGNVTNGSQGDATALLSGAANGIAIYGGAGRVTNFGTVTAADGERTIILRAGGSVANGSASATSALITGSGAGVYIGYGAGAVTNFGTIQSTGSGNGVALRDGGRVVNGSSGSTAALIVGVNAPSVIVSVAAGTISNFGTIEQNGTAPAVDLVQGGTISNGGAGAAGALITGAGTGIYADNDPVSVTNFGRIDATSTSRGGGIGLFAGGAVANFGTVQNADAASSGVYLHGGGSVTNGKGALISGAGSGVSVRGGAATVTNAGTIESATANGVYLTSGSVTNQAGGVIAGHTNGVYNRSSPIALTNSGLIETTGASDGVYLKGGGSLANTAGATIAGSAAGVALGPRGGVVTNRGVIKGVIGFDGGHAGGSTLINFGTVASTAAGGVAVEMGSSVGLKKLLVVEKGAVFTGLVEGGGDGEIEFAAPGTAAMGANISGFETIALANGGADSLTLTQANFTDVLSNRITVIGGNDGNTVNAAAVASSAVTIEGGAGADALIGSGNGNTIFVFSARTLTAADKIKGGGGFNNELDLTTPGTVAANGVSAVEIYRLANGGANTLSLTDANFVGAMGLKVVYGGNGGNTIDGSALAAGNGLDIYGGSGTDVLKGGAGDDIFVFAASALTAADKVSGGAGNDELLMTTAGTILASGVVGVDNYVLANGGPNTLTLTSGNFTGASGSAITISDGNDGNTVTAAAEPAAEHVVIYAGAGLDKLTGGAGNDAFFAGGDTSMTGGAGNDEFIFSAPGNNRITDFSTSEVLAFSNTGFNLGLSGSGALPPGLFVENSAGTFTSPGQRFVYDTADGKLFYSASGTAATKKLVAILTGAPGLTAAQLFHTDTLQTVFSGTYTSGIGLNPDIQRSVMVTGKITNASGDGIGGSDAFPWTISNRGTIDSTASFGVQLVAGGTINNLAAAGPASPGSLISGYNAGVLIEFAPGAVSNLGEIESTGATGVGVDIFEAGGSVTNGSAAATTASISAGGTGIAINGGVGKVANFGTVTTTSSGQGIRLLGGGSVVNGSGTSHAALISSAAGHTGVYVSGGAGAVTNFATIKGGNVGVFLDDGGRVANGASGSTVGLIAGAEGSSVLINGSTGTATNFGTLQSLSSVGVALERGGSVVNGAAGAPSALISSAGSGVYINNAAGTVANFGHIIGTSTSSGVGIALEDGGSVSNFGTIQNIDTAGAGVYMHGGSLTNGKAALISGVGRGVSSRGGPATVTNTGTIQSTASDGVYLTSGRVTNLAGGVIAGHINGVYNRDFSATVTNFGLIESTGTADGIYLRGGGTIVNNAGGTIAGSAAGVYFHRIAGMVTNHGLIKGGIGFHAAGTGANTLVNFGTVASTAGPTGTAVEMGNNAGTNLLVVEKGAVFTGAVLGGGRGEIQFASPGMAAMGANISGFGTVALTNGGPDILTLTNANFKGVTDGRITVIGGNAGNTVNASAVTMGPVTIDGGAGTDILTGDAAGNAIFVFAASALTAADKITGIGPGNELEVTTAGTAIVSRVTGVETYRLANGGALGNSLILKDGNFAGVVGGAITVYGGSGGVGNTIDGSGMTKAGENLVIYGGSGLDKLKGGAGNDVFSFTAQALTASDAISGGAGKNELLMTTAGTVHAAGVVGVETYILADGGPNTLTLGAGNFAGTGSAITVSDGNGGNTVGIVTALPTTDRFVVYAGTGADKLSGGDGLNFFHAGGNTTMSGSTGTTEFIFSAPGNNAITAFAASAGNAIVFSNSGFHLGLGGASATPKPLPAELFVADAGGTFKTTGERFAYDTTTGRLYYSPLGTTATEHLVATLAGTPPPPLATSHLFFIA